RRIPPLALSTLEPVGVAACLVGPCALVKERVVRLVRADHEVPRPVVRAIPIHVMDLRPSRERSPHGSLSDQDVLLLPPVASDPRRPHLDVALGDGTPAGPERVSRSSGLVSRDEAQWLTPRVALR